MSTPKEQAQITQIHLGCQNCKRQCTISTAAHIGMQAAYAMEATNGLSSVPYSIAELTGGEVDARLQPARECEVDGNSACPNEPAIAEAIGSVALEIFSQSPGYIDVTIKKA